MQLPPFRPLAMPVVAAILTVVIGVPWPLTADPTPVAAQSDDAAAPAPSPSPLPAAPLAARPSATYVGTTATGAPVRIEVAANGASIAWYEIGDLEAVSQASPATGAIVRKKLVSSTTVIESTDVIASWNSVPVLAWDKGCSPFSPNANALWLEAGRDVPIVEGKFSVGSFLAGQFDDASVSGTMRSSQKPGDRRCEASTTWTASVTP